jgi:hypothetical protein
MKQSRDNYDAVGITVPRMAGKSVCVVACLLSTFYLSSSLQVYCMHNQCNCDFTVTLIVYSPQEWINGRLFVEVMGRCENCHIFLLKSEKSLY